MRNFVIEGNLVWSSSVRSSEDIARLQRSVRSQAVGDGFSVTDQTKFVTAASELASNAIKYGGGGDASLYLLQGTDRVGLCLTIVDEGPGINDIARALTDGFTTGASLGLGLGGAQRLSDEFRIESELGLGTRVAITKWKRN